MAEPSRYNTGDHGVSNGQVLKNKMNIASQEELDKIEAILLSDAYEHFSSLLINKGFDFNVELLLEIHHYFLSPLYEWAGKLRTVNISKGGMMFASATFLPKTMEGLSKMISDHLPKESCTAHDLSIFMAFIHNEFNVIHPFRDGNGRTIRLFLDLIALNFGFNFIDYETFEKEIYIRACIEGVKANHRPMEELIFKSLTPLSS